MSERTPGCMVDGDPAAPVLIIAESPGREELAADRPLVGPAGRFLWAVLRDKGITRADCYIVNVIGELPAQKSGGPTAAQIGGYRLRFEEAVAKSKARIVVPLGSPALYSICGFAGKKNGIEAWRGYLIHPSECQPIWCGIKTQVPYKTSNKKKGIIAGVTMRSVTERVKRPNILPDTVEWIIPTLHPAGVLRSGKKPLPAFNADLGRVARALRRELQPVPRFIEGRETQVSIGGGPTVIDVETVPYLRVGMAGRRVGDDDLVAWTCPLDQRTRQTVLAEYQEPGFVFVAHNAPFDLNVMAQHGMPWDGPIFDTMIGFTLTQPDLYKGLNEVSSLLFDIPRWKHKAEQNPVEYNLTDVKQEYLLYEAVRAQLEADGMLQLFEGTICPGIKVLADMTRRGVPMHEARRQEWLEELSLRQNGLLLRWNVLADGANPRSPHQVKKVLYDKYGLPVKLNSTGGETSDIGALYEILADIGLRDTPARQMVETLIELRKNGKLIGNYAKRPVGDDGCVHPYYLPVAKDSDSDDDTKGMAGTGRIQARDPNVMQLPESARRIVIPRYPGEQSIVALDWSNQELRIACAHSGEERLLDELDSGRDIFTTLSQRYGCDRTRAKNLTYGTIYGGGPKALRNALRRRGVMETIARMKELQQAFFGDYPRLKRWMDNVRERVGNTYMLRNSFGRLRYFNQGRKDGSAAIDFHCQSDAADMLWACLKPAADTAARFGGELLITCHDELVFGLPNHSLNESIQALMKIMGREWPMIMPGFRVPVKAEYGPSWGELEEWKP